MSQEDGSIAGLTLEDATEEVVARDDARDPEEVRAALEYVTEDGVVSQAGVQSGLAEVSKVVATPETRVELADQALSDATESAGHVADLAAVQSRIDGFESQLRSIDGRVSKLGADLQMVAQRCADPNAIYQIASGIRRLTTRANDLQRTADDLSFEIEAFERWVKNGDVRYEQLDEDVDALEHSLEDLAGTIEEVGSGDEAVAWVDAAISHRVNELVLADIRAELDDLQTWAEREGIDDEAGEGIEERLDELDARLGALRGRLDGFDTGTERFDDEFESFETALDGLEAPFDWSEVQAVVEEHRAAITRSN